jgi:hypothetical protein
LASAIHLSASGFAKARESNRCYFCDFARQRSIPEIEILPSGYTVAVK